MTDKMIIILEDDIVLREHFSLVLENEGYTVVGAGDSEHILDLIEKYEPMLIITDLMMPFHNGRAGILKIIAHTNVPVIAISAFMDSIDSVKYLIEASLQKPVSDDDLLRAVRDVQHTCLVKRFDEVMHA